MLMATLFEFNARKSGVWVTMTFVTAALQMELIQGRV